MAIRTGRMDIRADPETLEAVRLLAQAKDVSVAWVIREALRRYIEQEHGLTRP